MLGKLVLLGLLGGSSFIYYKSHQLGTNVVPPIKDGYFGKGAAKADDATVKPFRISVPDAALAELRQRLEKAKFVEPLEDAAFAYGFPGTELAKVAEYWRSSYDWRKAEAELNAFSHFKTQIEGLDVHFIHSKPKPRKGKTILPLLIVHGWPGSVYEFHKLIPLLTSTSEGDYDFEVVAPSIPGYAWSQAPAKKRFGPIACARVFAKLMDRVGHKRYFIQGGDWGSLIVTNMAKAFPQRIEGVHTNMAPVPFMRGDPLLLLKKIVGAWISPSLAGVAPSDAAKEFPYSPKFMHLLQESGYFHIQTTKPDTAGAGLLDSPIGLAAWILEKFSTWTNEDYVDLKDGGLTKHFSLDQLLTNVMIYWSTGSIASSQRFYKECFREEEFSAYEDVSVHVPAGFANCPNELAKAPLAFLRHTHSNIVRYQDLPRCGHFAAFQEPQLIANDIIAFVADVKKPKATKKEL